MTEVVENRGFLRHARRHTRLPSQLGVHHLQRRSAREHGVLRFEHRPHPAAADLAHQPVRANHRTRCEID
jgi:hypothetical protein